MEDLASVKTYKNVYESWENFEVMKMNGFAQQN